MGNERMCEFYIMIKKRAFPNNMLKKNGKIGRERDIEEKPEHINPNLPLCMSYEIS